LYIENAIDKRGVSTELRVSLLRCEVRRTIHENGNKGFALGFCFITGKLDPIKLNISALENNTSKSVKTILRRAC